MILTAYFAVGILREGVGYGLGFEWDAANLSHLAEHDVTPEEAEQVIEKDSVDLDLPMTLVVYRSAAAVIDGRLAQDLGQLGHALQLHPLLGSVGAGAGRADDDRLDAGGSQ